MGFMPEKVDLSGPIKLSIIKKLILMEGQIFDFWGEFTGEASQDSNFFRAIFEYFGFSLRIFGKTLLPPYFNQFISTNSTFLC